MKNEYQKARWEVKDSDELILAQYRFLNDTELYTAEKLCLYYFNIALNMLVDELENDIDNLYFLIKL